MGEPPVDPETETWIYTCNNLHHHDIKQFIRYNSLYFSNAKDHDLI